MIGLTLVFLNFLVCNLLVERQILSIPHLFSFLGYYYFVAMRGVSIGLQGIQDLLSRMLCTCWQMHMGYDHSYFHHVLLIHHVHDHIQYHILYLRIFLRSCVYLCHGLQYLILKY